MSDSEAGALLRSSPLQRAHRGAWGSSSSRGWNLLLVLLYVAAAILIGRGAVTQNDTLFPLLDFANGRAPMPFQARYAMAPLLRWAGQSEAMAHLAHALRNSCRGPEELTVQLTDALCLVLCLPVVLALRRRFAPTVLLPWLAPALLLWIVAITFTVRYEQRLYMPYDFVSLLLFSVGVLACVDRRAWLFLLVLTAATYNRETTLFLIPVWLAFTWSRRGRALSLSTGAAGLLLWLLVRHQIHEWVGGGASGLMIDIKRNLTLLLPHHLAQVFSAAGYLALPMLLRRRLIVDRRLQILWFGLALFVVSDLAFGLWNETRIFGELSLALAITAAAQLEQSLRQQPYSEDGVVPGSVDHAGEHRPRADAIK